MTRFSSGSHAWLQGVLQQFGLQPRKPKRVRANLGQRDRSVQSLEQRVVLSAVTVAAVADSGQAQQCEAPNQTTVRSVQQSSLAARIVAAAPSNAASANAVPADVVNAIAEDVVSQQQKSARSNLRQNRLQQSQLIRGTHTTATSNVATNRASRMTATAINRTSAVTSQAASPVKLATSSLASRLGSSSASATSRLTANRFTSNRFTTVSSTTPTAKSTLSSGRSLQNSSLFNSKKVAQPSVQTTTFVQRARTESVVKSYVNNLQNRVLSFGISTGPSRMDSIRSLINSPSRFQSIPRPTGFNTGSIGGSSAYSAYISGLWKEFNRSYPTNPDRASVYEIY